MRCLDSEDSDSRPGDGQRLGVGPGDTSGVFG